MSGRLIVGDALAELRRLPAASVDMVMTSPPYADMRAKQYGGRPASEYVAWYGPIARELRRVLAPSGNYVLVIKEHTIDGEKSTYVHDLIADHRAAGFRWVDDYIWHKSAHTPGRFRDRLPDAWEHCLHFAPSRETYFDTQAARRPAAPSSIRRILHGQAKDEEQISATGSGHHVTYNNFDPYSAIATNVVFTSPVRHNVGHPAAYPVPLPAFFIPIMCPAAGTVLDPFAGSGTTAIAAERAGRRWIAIDRRADYIATARQRIGPTHRPLDAVGDLPESRRSEDVAAP